MSRKPTRGFGWDRGDFIQGGVEKRATWQTVKIQSEKIDKAVESSVAM
jgi:hypothetical protein